MYKLSTYLIVIYFPTYLPVYGFTFVTNYEITHLSFIHNWEIYRHPMDGVLVGAGSLWPYEFQIAASGQTIWEDPKVVPRYYYILSLRVWFPTFSTFLCTKWKENQGPADEVPPCNLPHVRLASVLQVCVASGHR
jgi:hypothetical protein